MELCKTKAVVHYRGVLEDGTEFDSTYSRGRPTSFIVGAHMMIPAFEAAVVSMTPGEKRYLRIPPEEAYGLYKDEYVIDVPKSNLPNSDQLYVGQMISVRTEHDDDKDNPGQNFTVLEITDKMLKLDMNHPLAGKTLLFDIELVKFVSIAPPGVAMSSVQS